MEGPRKAGLFVFAVSCVLLPGTLRAESYVVRIPQTAAPLRLEPSLNRLGDWEISVAFDAARCEIYCEYRRAERTPLTILARPPVVNLEVWRPTESVPGTMLVDPAGIHFPHTGSRAVLHLDSVGLPPRRLHAIMPDRLVFECDALRDDLVDLNTLPLDYSVPLPLRI